MVDPTRAASVLSKAIDLGLIAKPQAFDSDDAEAVRGFLDFAGVIDSYVDASDFARMAWAFGDAFRRYWQCHGQFAPSGGFRRFFSKKDSERRKEIELRTRAAALELHTWLDRPDGTRPLTLEEMRALSQPSLPARRDPLDTPYYRALRAAFADPDPRLLDGDTGDPPLLLTSSAQHQFARHFMLAYWDLFAQSTEPAGADVWTGERRHAFVRTLWLEDMAAWGARHVFGNVERYRRQPTDPLPFLPLEEMYVEPDGVQEIQESTGGKAASEQYPILGLLERFFEETRSKVIIVKADFGSGKSLTARTLAARWAERFLTELTPAVDRILPVFIRCADDFPGEGFDLAQAVRRAHKRQAEDFDLSLKINDTALAMPADRQRAIFILDGLDEVALGERLLESLFDRLLDEATDRHRFLIFSRPGALPDLSKRRGIAVVKLLPLQRAAGGTALAGIDGPGPRNQIGEWLDRWDRLTERRAPITVAMLHERGLLDIAATPILLLMIAHTWDEHALGGASANLAQIYEDFFWHIARGKHEADREQNRTVFDASNRLLDKLREVGELDQHAKAPDAMLWLMSRVAWEAHKLEQQNPPVTLRTRHVDNLVERELGIDDGEDAIRTIRVGLLLALQADLETKHHPILFGHKSFREFLVARYWADRLRWIARVRERDRRPYEAGLLGGRLLSRENKCFKFLMEMVNGALQTQRASPLGWTDAERKALVTWCQDQFENEEQDFGSTRSTALRGDRRPVLREAVLAIGSRVTGSQGLVDNQGRALRSMLAWFWCAGEQAIVIAPKAKLQGADLRATDLRGAVLEEADLSTAFLSGANLDQARLSRIVLRGAVLTEASFLRTTLERADLRRVDAAGTIFRGAFLEAANCENGRFNGAEFQFANLEQASFADAELAASDLSHANLQGANLTGANLGGAVFEGANLTGARLSEAIHNKYTRWPAFDPSAAGVKKADR